MATMCVCVFVLCRKYIHLCHVKRVKQANGSGNDGKTSDCVDGACLQRSSVIVCAKSELQNGCKEEWENGQEKGKNDKMK